MNKKVASEIAVGVILLIVVVVGGVFWMQNKKDGTLTTQNTPDEKVNSIVLYNSPKDLIQGLVEDLFPDEKIADYYQIIWQNEKSEKICLNENVFGIMNKVDEKNKETIDNKIELFFSQQGFVDNKINTNNYAGNCFNEQQIAFEKSNAKCVVEMPSDLVYKIYCGEYSSQKEQDYREFSYLIEKNNVPFESICIKRENENKVEILTQGKGQSVVGSGIKQNNKWKIKYEQGEAWDCK